MVPKRRGIAMIMALLMGVFVIVLALVLVAWVQADNDFAARTAMEMRAYDLARSGLDYYRVHPELVPTGVVATVVVSPGISQDQFTVTVDTVGDIISTGMVIRGNKTYNRTLFVPNGQFPDIRDEGSQ